MSIYPKKEKYNSRMQLNFFIIKKLMKIVTIANEIIDKLTSNGRKEIGINPFGEFFKKIVTNP